MGREVRKRRKEWGGVGVNNQMIHHLIKICINIKYSH